MEWAKYFSVILASAIKFIGGPIVGFGLNLIWWQTAALTIVGMMMSVIVVALLGKEIQKFIRKNTKSKPKLFSSRSRLAVKIWRGFGIIGIACLTPILFTPIGGTLIAISFKVSIPRLLSTMLLFAVIWGVIFTLLIYQLEGVRTLFS